MRPILIGVALIVVGCGAASATNSEAPPAASATERDSTATASDDAEDDTAGPEPTASAGPSAPAPSSVPAAPDAVPPCREASWAAATPVDLRAARPARVQERRLPSEAASASFTTDGRRLVYLLAGGDAFESIDLRRLRRQPVEILGDPTAEGDAAFALLGQTSEVGRLSFASGVRSHVTPISVRLGADRRVVHRIARSGVRHRVAWDLLTAVIGNRLVIVDPDTLAQRPALPDDVPISGVPTNVAAPYHVAFVGSDGRPHIADLSQQPPRCTTVAVRTPRAPRASSNIAASRSGRHLLYAVPTQVTATAQTPGFELVLVDLEQNTARTFATASGTEDLMVASVGGEERFIVAVHWADRDRTGLYDVDATSGQPRRLGRERPGFTHTLLASPDAAHVIFQTGMQLIRAVPPRPPRPPPPPRPDPPPGPDLDPRPRLGCDVYGCTGCGWMPDGCGGHQYCGDCPTQARQLPVRPSRHEGLWVIRLPSP